MNWKENLTKYAFWLGSVEPTDKENQVKMYQKYCFRYITGTSLKLLSIGIRIKQPDPDPYQSEKQDPDPHQKGLGPRHYLENRLSF